MVLDANNTPRTATQVQLRNNSPVTLRDSLSRDDVRDHYRFNVPVGQVRSFRARLDYANGGPNPANASANYDLELLRRNANNTFTSIAFAGVPGRDPEILSRNLEAGQYVVRVIRRSGRGNYRLTLQANNDTVSDNFFAPNFLGTIGPSNLNTASEFLGSSGSDPEFYSFRIDRRVNFELDVFTSNSSATATLFGASPDQVLATSFNTPNASFLRRTLNPGVYTLLVNSTGTDITPYTMRLSAPTVPDFGGSSENPIPIEGGLGFATFRREEYVGAADFGSDETDAYSFTANFTGELRVRLSDLTSDADVLLFDNNNPFIPLAVSNPGANGEEINFQVTQGQQYKIVVQRAGQNNTAFNLSALIRPSDQVGDNFAEATSLTPSTTPAFPNIGPAIQTYFDFAGTSPEETDTDIFRLDLTERRNFLRLRLRDLSANLNVRLWQQNPANPTQPTLVLSSLTPGIGEEILAGNLAQGTYFVEVLPGELDSESSYNLELSLRPGGQTPIITRDIFFDSGDAQAADLVNLNGTLFFTALDGSQDAGNNALRGLWSSDGTLTGTTRLAQFRDIGNLTPLAGTLYFTGDQGNGSRLFRWQSDGTPTGRVSEVAGQPGSPALFDPTGLVVAGNNIFFQAFDRPVSTDPNAPPRVSQLYWTNGTDIRVVQNSGALPGSFRVVDRDLTNTDTTDVDLFYVAFAQGITGGGVLHRIQNAGISTATNLTVERFDALGNLNLRNLNQLTVIANEDSGSSLFFAAERLENPISELYRFDLTETTNALTRYQGINEEGNPSADNLGGLVRALSNNIPHVYFAATRNGSEGNELWRINLQTNVPELVSDIRTGGSSNPRNFVVAPSVAAGGSDRIFFVADGGSTIGEELYVVQGTQVSLVRDMLPGTTGDPLSPEPLNSEPRNLVISGGTLYFTALTPDDPDGSTSAVEGGAELWALDLAVQGAQPTLVQDIFPGLGNSAAPAQLVDIGGQLYFTAVDGVTGREVWTVGGPVA